MKLICVNNEGFENRLTVGKAYFGGIAGDMFFITNDKGLENVPYYTLRFKPEKHAAKQTEKKYGQRPKDLGIFELNTKEMMFWLYLPVKLPGQVHYTLPRQVENFRPLLNATRSDMIEDEDMGQKFLDSYVYLSAKVMVITPDSPGNRPGWHSDGFMSDDLNYVWSDCSPTYYYVPDDLISLTADHVVSLKEMEAICHPKKTVTYPDKTFARLDETVIHRVGDPERTMTRSFAKVSVSKNRYDLVGNSINHDLAPDWRYYERSEIRNHPAKAGGDTSGMM